MFCVGMSPYGAAVAARFSKQIADRIFDSKIKVEWILRKILIRNDDSHNLLIS